LPGKLNLPIGGVPMLAHVYRRMTADGRRCIISVRAPIVEITSAIPESEYVLDEYPDAGPLGGLVSAAARVHTPLFFAAAGDMPNMDVAFVYALAHRLDQETDAGNPPEAVVPVWPDGRREPLAALYDTKAFLLAGRQTLSGGQRKVTAAVDLLHVVAFPVGAQDEDKLANVNTRSDYDAYRS
jgi:molybdopterin-guanine dinucleotide biosynthesis protein A